MEQKCPIHCLSKFANTKCIPSCTTHNLQLHSPHAGLWLHKSINKHPTFNINQSGGNPNRIMLCRSCWLYLLPHHVHLDIQLHQHYSNLSFTKNLFRTKLFIFRDSSCLRVRITLEAKSSRQRVTWKISSRRSPCSIKSCGSAIHPLKRSFGLADQWIELTLSKKLSNSTSAFPQALMFPQVNYTNLCQSFEFFMQ